MSKRIGWTIAVLIAATLGALYFYRYWSRAPEQMPVETPVAVELPVPQASTEPVIRHPVPSADPSVPGTASLPPLKESDRVLQESFTGIFGQKPVEDYLIPQNLIRRLVVTIDNLPRRKAAVEMRPVKPAPGAFIADQESGQTPGTAAEQETATLSPQNYERYKPLVQALEAADAKKIASVYLHFYPLFQQSYEDLGYPGRYFNDRLVEAIDHLLDTPDVQGPIKLIRPKVFYEFADPELEARSAGQKLLIRIGGENAAIVKRKLRELRDAVASTP